jgi:hypothetical protein
MGAMCFFLLKICPHGHTYKVGVVKVAIYVDLGEVTFHRYREDYHQQIIIGRS